MEYTFKAAKYYSHGWGKIPVLIVVHWVAGSFNSCIRTFADGLREASAHFVISKTGEVVQMVDLKNRAWHAGKSETKDFGPHCNNYSFGIELEGPPSFVGSNGWNDEQIKSLVEVCKHIQKEVPTVQFITDHSTISPGRKIDVKGSTGKKVDIFPWSEFINQVQIKEIK
jgi:N-acetyl-anhydromuramyl-L-alanine amidase AmpD